MMDIYERIKLLNMDIKRDLYLKEQELYNAGIDRSKEIKIWKDMSSCEDVFEQMEGMRYSEIIFS
jgi:hypothetical protein